MKFRVSITYEYDVDPVTSADDYGTTVPAEMAEIDRRAIQDDPGVVSADLTNGYTVAVTPVEV